MRASTIIGMVCGIALIVVTGAFAATDPWVLFEPLSALFVLGGTLAATFVAFPARDVLRVFRVFWIVLSNEKLYREDDVEELARVSRLAHKGDLRKLEQAIRAIRNPFLRTGLQLIADGTPIDDIVSILTWRIEKLKAKERADAEIFRAMAQFAPAFGMAGTLLGLLDMLYNIGTDISAIGTSLALALMTTLYGILATTVIFKPIALKLEHRTELRVELMNLIVEGICMMARRQTPSAIRQTLESYTAEIDDEIRDRGELDPDEAASVR